MIAYLNCQIYYINNLNAKLRYACEPVRYEFNFVESEAEQVLCGKDDESGIDRCCPVLWEELGKVGTEEAD